MEFKDVVLSRKSVRKYKDTPIENDMLREIMELGITAPSATNLQQWYFVAVSSPEKRAELDIIMKDSAEKLLPTLNKRFPNHPQVVKETYSFTQSLGGAPVCILAFLQKEYENMNDATQSVAAAMENIVLAARDKGLDTCWLTAPIDVKKDKELEEHFAPGKGKFLAMLTMGYSDQPNARSPKRRDNRYVII